LEAALNTINATIPSGRNAKKKWNRDLNLTAAAKMKLPLISPTTLHDTYLKFIDTHPGSSSTTYK